MGGQSMSLSRGDDGLLDTTRTHIINLFMHGKEAELASFKDSVLRAGITEKEWNDLLRKIIKEVNKLLLPIFYNAIKSRCSLEFARELLNLGVNPHVLNEKGVSAFHLLQQTPEMPLFSGESAATWSAKENLQFLLSDAHMSPFLVHDLTEESLEPRFKDAKIKDTLRGMLIRDIERFPKEHEKNEQRKILIHELEKQEKLHREHPEPRDLPQLKYLDAMRFYQEAGHIEGLSSKAYLDRPLSSKASSETFISAEGYVNLLSATEHFEDYLARFCEKLERNQSFRNCIPRQQGGDRSKNQNRPGCERISGRYRMVLIVQENLLVLPKEGMSKQL